MKEKENYFWRGDWDDAIRRMVLEKMNRSIKGVYCNGTKIAVYGNDGTLKLEPTPLFVREWIEANPAPEISRDQFLHELGERVLALEASLAEKGITL